MRSISVLLIGLLLAILSCGTEVDKQVPSPPTGLQIESQDEGTLLTWSPNVEQDVAGYNIYRSDTRGAFHFKLTSELVPASPQPSYKDTFHLDEGRAYYYAVTAVDGAGNESIKSAEASSSDMEPPSLPGGVRLKPDEGNIVITWFPNTESDLAGYNVYRSSSPNEPHARINAGLLHSSTHPPYLDSFGVVQDRIYHYVVTAVDGEGNESAKSVEVTTAAMRLALEPSIDLLPDDIQGWAATGIARRFDNPALLSLLIGEEADTLAEHGFRSCVLQEYSDGRMTVMVHIYVHATQTDAEAAYDAIALENNSGSDRPSAGVRTYEVGSASYRMEFWQSNMLIRVIADSRTAQTFDIAKTFSIAVSSKISLAQINS